MHVLVVSLSTISGYSTGTAYGSKANQCAFITFMFIVIALCDALHNMSVQHEITVIRHMI